ncbi:glycosyltransferase family 9 protein [Solitalea koreensis]|uniref:ADP-heptose:LPS heptosyltransferase n=1 Tax=Solitalea koreensis TaxID=543615 RepID=A0A521D978_9SPHI|nr:glycosyltransferase family 9 protein [Solitalea koreensis]SMO68185.1 ADP-heptose:LPS heptosyltransferase [Solitalea koreensis]
MTPKTKILILRFSSIGDVVWTTPVIRAVKQQLPNVELHFAVKSVFKDIVAANPYIDKLHLLTKENLKELTQQLKEEQFDYVIDLHNNLRTRFIKSKLGGKHFTYKKLSVRRFLFIHFKWKVFPDIPVVERYLKTVESLGVRNDGKGLDYFISPENEIKLSDLPAALQNGYDAFVIGGSAFTKLLPFNKMVELCNKINRPIALIGGKEDIEPGDKLQAYYEEKIKNNPDALIHPVINFSGKLNISQSASMVKQAGRVFGHDTGLTHIGAAFHDTVYSIWGTTSPISFRPYCKNPVVFENNNLNCRPCSKAGRDSCPQGHFKCMREITFDF